MDRRTFSKLASLAAVSAFAEAAESHAQPPVASGDVAPDLGKEIVLEDAQLRVAFDSVSGALVRMERKSGHWVIERRPDLGVSFRLFVPLTKRRDNFILGTKQRAVSVQKIGPNQVRMRWENLLSEHGGVMPIAFTGTVTLDNGKLTFDAEWITSPTASSKRLTILISVISIHRPGCVVEAHHMWVGALFSDPIYPRFDNAKGYWGVRYPTRTIESSQSQFCLLQTPSREFT